MNDTLYTFGSFASGNAEPNIYTGRIHSLFLIFIRKWAIFSQVSMSRACETCHCLGAMKACFSEWVKCFTLKFSFLIRFLQGRVILKTLLKNSQSLICKAFKFLHMIRNKSCKNSRNLHNGTLGIDTKILLKRTKSNIKDLKKTNI